MLPRLDLWSATLVVLLAAAASGARPYHAVPDTDVPSVYIRKAGGACGLPSRTPCNVTELAAACDTTPGCLAFNSNGWLKPVLRRRKEKKRKEKKEKSKERKKRKKEEQKPTGKNIEQHDELGDHNKNKTEWRRVARPKTLLINAYYNVHPNSVQT